MPIPQPKGLSGFWLKPNLIGQTATITTEPQERTFKSRDGSSKVQVGFEMEINGTTNWWTPSNTTYNELAQVLGQEGSDWVGKKIQLTDEVREIKRQNGTEKKFVICAKVVSGESKKTAPAKAEPTSDKAQLVKNAQALIKAGHAKDLDEALEMLK